jgi:imidazolonepropionase-like amidohydrolase
MNMKNILYIAILFLCIQQATAQPDDILIKNGTVITITDGVKENTDVLIRNGKISKIGEGLVADGIETIDAEGLYVMPGIIDAHSHIALDAVNEATNPVTAEVAVGDALDPYDINIYRALAGGVTISHAMHGSANAIGGQCETIKHRWGVLDPEDLIMDGAMRTIKFALGENPMRVHGERSGIVPATRMGIEQVFRLSFEEGKAYAKEWSDYNSGKTKVPPTFDLRKETIADILSGEIMIHCHSYRADEILMLMNVLKDYGVDKITFQHVNEGFKVAPELAEFGAYASVFSDWWAYKFEVYYSTAYNAAILTKNGVVTSINSDSRELIRHLYHEAAKAQKYGGLTDLEALSLITINPAIQLGIDERVGSIEVGKEGDIVVFKNHPLSVYAIPQYTIVDGVVRFNIMDDPADMRVDVDPEEEIPAFYQSQNHHHHDHDHIHSDEGCLQGAFDYLLEEKH